MIRRLALIVTLVVALVGHTNAVSRVDAATGCYLYKSTYSASTRCQSGKYRVGITYYCGSTLTYKFGPWRYSWDPASVAGVPIECPGQPTVRTAWTSHG